MKRKKQNIGRKKSQIRASLKPSALIDQSSLSAADNPHKASLDFPIVGIGASAGGLEAFTQLLKNLPNNAGLAYVFVLHLDPKHESRLTEILSKVTRMPVIDIKNGMPVKPDHVFIIPPNVNLTITQRLFKLTPRGNELKHFPIDHLFQSLAQEQDRAIGIVLSGMGSDGTLGLAEIKAAGGITFCQDERSSQHHMMPINAIQNGHVDFILPPDEIAHALTNIARHPYLSPVNNLREGKLDSAYENALQKILVLLKTSKGVDFRRYKDPTIKRRINCRLVLCAKKDLGEYLSFLEKIDWKSKLFTTIS